MPWASEGSDCSRMQAFKYDVRPLSSFLIPWFCSPLHRQSPKDVLSLASKRMRPTAFLLKRCVAPVQHLSHKPGVIKASLCCIREIRGVPLKQFNREQAIRSLNSPVLSCVFLLPSVCHESGCVPASMLSCLNLYRLSLTKGFCSVFTEQRRKHQTGEG